MSKRTVFQFFHWYSQRGSLWKEVSERAAELAALGISDVWLPPAYKGASGAESVGYDTYDLFDLGEFEQKGSIATKYGERAAFEAACKALVDQGMRPIHDVVLNHKMGADEMESVVVRRVNADDRTQIDEEEVHALAYTRFTFPGREGKYSKFIWDKNCFSGVDLIEKPSETGVFRLMNEYGEGQWNGEVDDELGNFDYLMGADVEFRNKAVYEELKFWGRWFAEQVPVAGFRLDAAKHIPAWFFKDWVGHMRDTIGTELFVVAEYWHPDVATLSNYLELVDKQLKLFDVALHHRFHDASKAGAEFDMRTMFDGSLVSSLPDHSVTLVDNHDTQPLQSLEATVEPWFKPLAYALILLREQGTPCVFYPDLYGAEYIDVAEDGNQQKVEMPTIGCLSRLLEARQQFANGLQVDIFDDPNVVAFIRQGTETEPGCVVVMSNGNAGQKFVDLGPDHSNAAFIDFLGHHSSHVTTDQHGRGEFPTNGGSVSVWVRADR
ncbi:alpha-amylase [Rhizobium sp. 16-449-1b]|uniref:alpha-amylase n=1 Tax=Rhizobium sp. 16-449-1b TaxID=2819989 RepID=UPI001ADBE636|nr:alpha-amylase [Rhizobium sp. 16-449-1b]MBO9198290.1 alpha-amylase [Rhizobium sp. 16-449-1b]